MPLASATRRLEAGDFESPEVQRLFNGELPQDEIDWIEELLTIDSVDAGGQVVKFNLYPQQVQMAHDKTGRDMTVKGRQTRASSLILAKNLRRMATHWGMKCLTMTQDDQTTATFRARIEHHLKDLTQKGFDFPYTSNKDELVFKDTESRYIWGSGQEVVAGRAFSAHIAHLSEVAHWPHEKAKTLMGGILPSVPGPPGGWIDIESTPNGSEGQFHDMVDGSKHKDPMSRWTTHFYPWSLEPRYRAGTTPDCDILYTDAEMEALLRGFKPTPEEEKVIDLLDLDVGQVLWRRVRKSEQDKTDAPFLQEYVETLDGCFLVKGGNYFASPDGLNHLEQYKQTVKPPKEIVESLPNSSVSFAGAGLHVWQRPELGRGYAVWVDCAGGGLDESADYTAICVLDCANMFIAARLCVKVAPQEAAPMAVAIAQYYNEALLGGERDAFGSVCVAKIQEIGYRKLWYYVEPGQALSIKKPVQDAWGHPTQIRQHILPVLREKVFGGLFHMSDGWGLQQMGAFTWQKVAQKRHGLKEAGKGQKDDIVMCYAGLCYIAPLVSSSLHRGAVNFNEPPKENEIVFVGRHGLVVDRKIAKAGSGPKPWLR